MKTATHGTDEGRSWVNGIDCSPSPRMPEMETEKSSTSYFPLSISFVHRLHTVVPAHTKPVRSIVRRSITLHAGMLCEAFTWLRLKISNCWDIWQISCEIGDSRRRSRRKRWKKLDAVSRFESFFSLSLERQRSAGKVAHRCTHTGSSVFDRRQKYCLSVAHLDGLVNLRLRSNGEVGQIKRCGPTRVGADA